MADQDSLTTALVRPIRPFGTFRTAGFIAALLIVTAAGSAQESSGTSEPVDFSREIRPILSNHCFQCHGADEETRGADLRLDNRNSAIDSGAIVPGKSRDSVLVERILADDASIRMPPDESGKPLTPAQMELLKRWIDEGAEYREHWAFRRVERPMVPDVGHPGESISPVDAFIRKKLKERGLQAAPEADRSVLIRRAAQDVTGLLPTVEEADAFLSDTSPDAWEKVVDRLLNNPHYGERWGRHWLDQARYADSNGYTIDGPRVMWPFRDWVIAALNRDLPFDQFTIEQLAGDLLPDATTAQKVASAFHRNTMINEEGGVKPDQFRHEALIDRVNTTGAVWLGLTVGCAQCHSHKYDPVSHEEYYRLYAFFNAARDANNVADTIEVLPGEMLGWSEKQQQQLSELRSLRLEKSRLEKQITSRRPLSEHNWNWQPVDVSAVRASGSVILKVESDGSLLVKSQPDATDSFFITFQPRTSVGVGEPELANAAVQEKTATMGLTALRLRVLPHPSLPKNGPGTAGNGNFVLTDISLQAAGTEKRFHAAWADHSQPDFPVEHAIDDRSDSGWAINVDAKQAVRGVLMNAPHEAIFAAKSPVEFDDGVLSVHMKHELNKNYLVGHFAFEYSNVPLPEDAGHSDVVERLAEVEKRIGELESVVPARGVPVRQMVMKDQDSPPETFLLERGDFLSPDRNRGALSPGVPAVLAGHVKHADSDSATPAEFRSRLDLARWLVSRDNPLTARVTVNRIWAGYFGRGLVETENDFGFQGTLPTHPELLDWLAAEFMENGWSMKKLHRTILLSAAYRQSSAVSDARQAALADPENYLLARQSRFRVEAEIVRDQAVFASGLFNPDIGGPGVHLPQPDGIYDFTQNKKNWPTATGPDRYRRTMYTMFYRSAPYPLFSTFDAPDFSTVCTRRVRSNTPLQSLTMANDVVFVELAEGLARRVLNIESLHSDEQLCSHMFRLCLTREPTPEELDVLQGFYGRELTRFLSSAADAAVFLSSPSVRSTESSSADGNAGEPTTDDGRTVSLAKLAALTSVARALFNTDEFVTRN